jgi:hypothetical protein
MLNMNAYKVYDHIYLTIRKVLTLLPERIQKHTVTCNHFDTASYSMHCNQLRFLLLNEINIQMLRI